MPPFEIVQFCSLSTWRYRISVNIAIMTAWTPTKQLLLVMKFDVWMTLLHCVTRRYINFSLVKLWKLYVNSIDFRIRQNCNMWIFRCAVFLRSCQIKSKSTYRMCYEPTQYLIPIQGYPLSDKQFSMTLTNMLDTTGTQSNTQFQFRGGYQKSAISNRDKYDFKLLANNFELNQTVRR